MKHEREFYAQHQDKQKNNVEFIHCSPPFAKIPKNSLATAKYAA
jgi:hypothetical protein